MTDWTDDPPDPPWPPGSQCGWPRWRLPWRDDDTDMFPIPPAGRTFHDHYPTYITNDNYP